MKQCELEPERKRKAKRIPGRAGVCAEPRGRVRAWQEEDHRKVSVDGAE